MAAVTRTVTRHNIRLLDTYNHSYGHLLFGIVVSLSVITFTVETVPSACFSIYDFQYNNEDFNLYVYLVVFLYNPNIE